jgi:hypothetical protein
VAALHHRAQPQISETLQNRGAAALGQRIEAAS